MTEPAAPELSVVVSTYEWPEALGAVLAGLAEQRATDLEVVVAEDGQSSATAAMVERWTPVFAPERLRHVTQEDRGFRLARVRDLGALHARGRMLVFLDGDCIPRRDFAAATTRYGLTGWFLGTKRVELGAELSRRVLGGAVAVHRWGASDLLLRGRGQAEGLVGLSFRDRRRAGRDDLPEFVPDREAWGFYLAVRRDDFERVNGYDVRYEGWGGEDVDLATRLRRAGLKGGWAGPAATVLHLFHPDRTPAERPNADLLDETRASGRVRAPSGLDELRAEL